VGEKCGLYEGAKRVVVSFDRQRAASPIDNVTGGKKMISVTIRVRHVSTWQDKNGTWCVFLFIGDVPLLMTGIEVENVP
jgi:hypothetical protein